MFKALDAKGLVTRREIRGKHGADPAAAHLLASRPLPLNREQANGAGHAHERLRRLPPCPLHGVTGSGKTGGLPAAGSRPWWRVAVRRWCW
ncbi:hypothetical protein DSL92_07445 [Billgrantia gudaonensis]|uniref:Uncharacterized protein n=1 Tax=Billgrantia gudaonensis TaxID=376427 RepID=A0A3S0VSI1_9GAMM|nr:hypothetical protein DSL92_07445 [Halomonas gudaonensis]